MDWILLPTMSVIIAVCTITILTISCYAVSDIFDDLLFIYTVTIIQNSAFSECQNLKFVKNFEIVEASKEETF